MWVEVQNIIFDFFQFILNPGSSPWFLTFKFIFLSIDLFMVGFIIFAFLTTSWIRRLIIHDLVEFTTYRPHAVSKVEKEWEEIKEKMATEKSHEIKLAVIEANALLDKVLGQQGYVGETLGEKLKNLNRDIISVLPNLKKVHDTVSNIAHDPTYRLEVEEAEEILSVYKEALIELQAL